MNIFTAAIAGLMVVIKKIGIGFKAVMTGLKIAIISVIDFIVSLVTAIVNAVLSAIKWMLTQIVNLIHWLFRTYLWLECGWVPPVQKFAGLMIRLRWGFVIVSVLYAVYQYLGIKALVVAIAVCGGLIAIGYSEAEKEEEEWNVHLDKLNSIIEKYLKYLIRFSITTSSAYSLTLVFHSNKDPNLSKEFLQGLSFINGQSHPPAEEMRVKHMEVLKGIHITAKGYNPVKDGKKSCLACHSSKEQFCDSCHAYDGNISVCWLSPNL
jgi:hypothetical protein